MIYLTSDFSKIEGLLNQKISPEHYMVEISEYAFLDAYPAVADYGCALLVDKQGNPIFAMQDDPTSFCRQDIEKLIFEGQEESEHRV